MLFVLNDYFVKHYDCAVSSRALRTVYRQYSFVNMCDSLHFSIDSCIILTNKDSPASPCIMKAYNINHYQIRHKSSLSSTHTTDSTSIQKSVKASKTKTPVRKSTSYGLFIVFLIVLLLFCCYKAKSGFASAMERNQIPRHSAES